MESLDVIVASSREQIRIAARVAALLNEAGATGSPSEIMLAAHPWTDKTFMFSNTYIESLEHELDRADFAVVILTASDLGRVRHRQVNLPRDNVTFELGLFIGRFSRQRCFFFVDAASNTRIASDLSGVKEVDFVSGKRGSRAGDRGLATRCAEVAAHMIRQGPRYKPSPAARERQQEMWRAARDIAGHWWSLRYWDKQRLGFVTLNVDETLPTLTVSGESFAPDTPSHVNSRWNSKASTLIHEESKWKLYYVWEGRFLERPEETFRGSSSYEFTFSGSRPASGNGSMLEANLGGSRTLAKKSSSCDAAPTRKPTS